MAHTHKQTYLKVQATERQRDRETERERERERDRETERQRETDRERFFAAWNKDNASDLDYIKSDQAQQSTTSMKSIYNY